MVAGPDSRSIALAQIQSETRRNRSAAHNKSRCKLAEATLAAVNSLENPMPLHDHEQHPNNETNRTLAPTLFAGDP